jgi:3-oxoadipate enol-lactonase
VYVSYAEPEPGVRVRYAVYGSGRPVVIVHGLTQSMDDWLWLASALASEGLTTILLDLRGHGGSTRRLPRPPRLADYASDIMAVARELGLGEFAAVGFSLGGYALLQLERMEPGTIGPLLLASSAHRPGDPEGMARRARLAREGRVEELAREIAEAVGVSVEAARALLSRLDLELYASTVESIASADFSRELERVARARGATAVVGDRDRLVGVEVAAEMERLGVRVRLLRGKGHLLNVEAREEIEEEAALLFSPPRGL